MSNGDDDDEGGGAVIILSSTAASKTAKAIRKIARNNALPDAVIEDATAHLEQINASLVEVKKELDAACS